METNEYPKSNHSEKILKKTTTYLSRWNGGTAIMETITTSHPTLVINVYKAGNQGWLKLRCLDPIWIKGYRIWENCDIELKVESKLKNDEFGYILLDTKNELEIHCTSFESSENLPKKTQRVV